METRFSEAASVSPYGMLIVNREGTIKYVNKMMTEMFQYSESEMMGSNVEMFLPRNLRDKHLEYIEKYFEQPEVKEMASSSRNVSGEKKDGTSLFVEIGLSPIQDNSESCALAIVQDVTERVKHKSELEKFRKFYDAAPIGFYRTNLLDGSFLMANPACVHMLGFQSFEEMKSIVKASDLYPTEERKDFLQMIQENGKICDYEIEVTLLDGKKMNVLISGTMCADEDCIEGSITDITDKHRMQRELNEYKAKGLAEARQTGFMIAAKLEECDLVDCEPVV